jgi:hypothetical protein
MLALTRRKKRARNRPFLIEHMAYTNLATKLLLNDMQVNAGPLGNGFPYLKFAWEVELAVGSGGESTGLFSTGPLVAKSCELPRFSIETQVVNVYNHKTIVQTKMNYEPITMTFYDQTNDVAESLIWDFVKGQFDPGDASKANSITPLVVTIKMKNLSGEGDDKVYTLLNAYITDAQHDTLDYSTSDPVLWTITLRYEELQTNDFKGKTPGDGGAGIKALPKPPSRPSVVNVPITKPPKADAKIEEVSMWTDPMGTTDGAAIMAAAGTASRTQSAPKATAPWPMDKTSNDVTYDAMGNVTSFSSGNPSSASTGTPVTKVQSPATTQQAAAARAAYAQTDPRRIDGEGYNPSYKEAYASEYAKEMSKYDTSWKSQSGKASIEQRAAQAASMRALTSAPKYSSQVRTQNADGSFTDRQMPRSVNNNASASASQSNREQQYVNNSKKPLDY